jgi:hypothetical protein
LFWSLEAQDQEENVVKFWRNLSSWLSDSHVLSVLKRKGEGVRESMIFLGLLLLLLLLFLLPTLAPPPPPLSSSSLCETSFILLFFIFLFLIYHTLAT